MPVILNNNKVFTIRTKLALVVSLLFAAISIFIFLYFPARQERQAINAISDKANSVALIMAYSIAPALYFNDSTALEEVIKSAITNKDLIYILVSNDSGRAIETYNSGSICMEDIEKSIHGQSYSQRGPLYHISTPVLFKNQKVGDMCL
jgi:hypothetical protein